MVSVRPLGLSGPSLIPGQGHFVMFLGKTLDFHSYLYSPRCMNGYWQILCWGLTVRRTSIQSRESTNTSIALCY